MASTKICRGNQAEGVRTEIRPVTTEKVGKVRGRGRFCRTVPKLRTLGFF